MSQVTRPKSYDTNYDKWDRIVDSDSDDEPGKKSKSKSKKSEKSKPGEINSIEDLDANDRRCVQIKLLSPSHSVPDCSRLRRWLKGVK